MYKVFAYIGSYRGNESYSVNITKKLVKYLSLKLSSPMDIKFHTPLDIQIENCKGCTNCFTNGKCPINDDASRIKKEMLESDIIIFASPVYFHQVSGCMKTFIDRLSYWAHIFQLRGKIGISINVSDTNGNIPVEEYLNKFMGALGLSVIQDISIQSGKLNRGETFKSIIRVLGNRIITILNSKQFPIESTQEVYFQTIKSCMKIKENNSFEKMYWENNSLFKYNSFHEMFENCCKLNK